MKLGEFVFICVLATVGHKLIAHFISPEFVEGYIQVCIIFLFIDRIGRRL